MTLTNTQQRILSGIVIGLLTVGIVLSGRVPAQIFILLGGLLVTDEILTNFVMLQRKGLSYFLGQLTLLVPFIVSIFVLQGGLNKILSIVAFIHNLLLLIYLFSSYKDFYNLPGIVKRYPLWTGFFVFMPLQALASITLVENWEYWFFGVLLINFAVDTGAWFIGKKFGKRKLWEKVSPKKTLEGAIGGVLFSSILGCFYWSYVIKVFGVRELLLILTVSFTSQIGDLIQSKIKREFNIKDSSTLIPGHGGVYDRVDSLLFVAPFFVILMNSLN